MNLQTYETSDLDDAELLDLSVDLTERETYHEIMHAIGEIEALMHGTYAARRWGVTDQLPGGTGDLDMFAMRLPDGSGIEELVACSETRSIHRKTIDRTYAVDIFSEGLLSQQLRLDENGRLEVSVMQREAENDSKLVRVDDDDALDVLYEFRYRMSIARDRVDRRSLDERAAADTDALGKLKRQVYGADMKVTSVE